MACCYSSPVDDHTKLVELSLKREWKAQERVNKLLLLGASQGGKSTLFKQMFVIYGKGFSVGDRKRYISIVWLNVVGAIEELVLQSIELSSKVKYADCEVKDGKALASLRFIRELKYTRGQMNDELASHIKTLWADPAIQHTFALRSKFQLDDSAEYFLNESDRVLRLDYLPTQHDVIRARHKTTAIVEHDFTIDQNRFKMLDVGGQRNERRKWIHCFSDVTAIIFVVAISEYDQVLYEDQKVNRLVESLNLFEKICESKYFKQTNIILFLNKRDLFARKLKSKPLGKYFPDFKGGDDYDKAVDFLTQEFWRRSKVARAKKIYTHVTCATDTENIKVVFNSVRHTVVGQALSAGGMV